MLLAHMVVERRRPIQTLDRAVLVQDEPSLSYFVMRRS